MSNDASDILGSLERELILRKFNTEYLGFEDAIHGSDTEKIVGVGRRTYKPTNESKPVVDFYFSYFRRIVMTFQHTSVAKHFGLSIKDALSMPVNQWYDIEREAKLLTENEGPSEISKLTDMIKQFLEVMIVRPE